MERFVICAEKKYLDDRIHECVSLVALLSKQAAELARNDLSLSIQEFQSIQSEIVSESLRLKTLRECLDIHRQYHGC